jgi:hypothetical protein
MADYILPMIIGLAVFIGVFILLREFFCWYFKINQNIRILQFIAETQVKIYEQAGGKVDKEKMKSTLY